MLQGMHSARWLVALALLGGLAQSASAQVLSVAAASDLHAAMPRIAARFERETGHRVRVIYGSSGNFYAQIRNGAPFDVLCSADIDYPRQLVKDGLAVASSFVEYAEGRLAVWTRKDSGLTPGRGLALLGDARVRRVAIANPAHAPYGRAAVAALTRAGMYDQVRAKLVFGENVVQAAQFAQSGNADAAIVALSLVLAPAMAADGIHAVLTPDSHPPIAQAAVAVAASPHQALAARFLAFLRQPDAAADLRSFGFTVP
jgi:molybdate transport system substrate-binding protein